MNNEENFLHDIINQLSMAHGELKRVLKKKEQLSKEEIIQNIEDLIPFLDKSFDLLKKRREEIDLINQTSINSKLISNS